MLRTWISYPYHQELALKNKLCMHHPFSSWGCSLIDSQSLDLMWPHYRGDGKTEHFIFPHPQWDPAEVGWVPSATQGTAASRCTHRVTPESAGSAEPGTAKILLAPGNKQEINFCSLVTANFLPNFENRYLSSTSGCFCDSYYTFFPLWILQVILSSTPLCSVQSTFALGLGSNLNFECRDSWNQVNVHKLE